MNNKLAMGLNRLSRSVTANKEGTLAVFANDSIADKVQSAETLAAKTNRKLVRVVTSQYIGETEKNLSTLFQRAEREDWVLFFDEADALFGKRTDVKDGHDRYANKEVSHLLKRLEGFKGVAILSTNVRATLDPYWRKRLRRALKFS